MKRYINTQFNEAAVKIREAKPEDAAALANLYCRAYRQRFFDADARGRDGKKYGAPLAREFPELEKGQDADWFRDYTRDFLAATQSGDDAMRNTCYVAETMVDGKPAIIGFIKGSAGPVEEDIYKEVCKKTGTILPREKWGELGSVYIDPDVQTAGVGRQLVKKWAELMRDSGREAMITRAYAGNDSPYFFAKLGAEDWMKCTIPNGYYAYDDNGGRETATVDIPGVCMIWDPGCFDALANSPDIARITKGETVTGRKMADIDVPEPVAPPVAGKAAKSLKFKK